MSGQYCSESTSSTSPSDSSDGISEESSGNDRIGDYHRREVDMGEDKVLRLTQTVTGAG